MRKDELIALIGSMTEGEKREMLAFLQLLHSRQEEGRTVTQEETAELAAAACKRLEAVKEGVQA